MGPSAQQPLDKDRAPPGRTLSVDNNFNLLRLAFALMVAAYHAAILPGVIGWKAAEPYLTLAAEIGVQGFFVLSGYLVYASLERSPSLALYTEKRIRRLYPAYATVVIVCAAAAIAISPAARAAPVEVARYLGWNLVFLNFMAPGIPGVFDANRFTEINGALWTLKIEVMFYVILPLLAWALRAMGSARWLLILAVYASAEAWRIGLQHLAQQGQAGLSPVADQLWPQLPGQMSFFITGIAFRMLNPSGAKLHLAGVLGIVLLAASVMRPEAEPVRALGLGAVAIWIATGLPRLIDAARFGDLSYGLYIVHFPIIQGAIAAGLFAASAWAGLAVSAAGALIAALLLWHLVERPALRADSAYRSHA